MIEWTDGPRGRTSSILNTYGLLGRLPDKMLPVFQIAGAYVQLDVPKLSLHTAALKEDTSIVPFFRSIRLLAPPAGSGPHFFFTSLSPDCSLSVSFEMRTADLIQKKRDGAN